MLQGINKMEYIREKSYLIKTLKIKNRVMEEDPQEFRSEKEYILKVSKEYMKRGKGTDGTAKKGTRNKMERGPRIKLLGMGYEVGCNIPP